MKYTLTILFALFLACSLSAQSKTVSQFSDHTQGYKLFLYQSMIRMLNKDQNPEFNMLIQDLEYLKLATTDSVGASALNTFKTLDKGIVKEGFEEIVSFDNKDSRCHIYELESSSGESSWVAVLYFVGYAGVLEMQGVINPKYLNSLSSLNMDRLKDILPIDEFDIE